jgi:hypothetical protein
MLTRTASIASAFKNSQRAAPISLSTKNSGRWGVFWLCASLTAGSLLSACGGGGGGGTGGNSGSGSGAGSSDFSLNVSPSTPLSAPVGTALPSATLEVKATGDFSDATSISVGGLPAGATIVPASPFVISVGSSQTVQISLPLGMATGLYSVTFQGTAGGLSHTATLSISATSPSASSYAGIWGTNSATTAACGLDKLTPLPATTYYVAPTGSDLNPGTMDLPFATVQKCAQSAPSGAACAVRAGSYHETVTPNSGVLVTAYNGEAVEVDGADRVSGWTLFQGSIYKSSVVLANDDTNQLFVGTSAMTEARWPNSTILFQPAWATLGAGTTETTLVDSSLPAGNWSGARVHYWSGKDPWVHQTAVVTASAAGSLTTKVEGASYTQTSQQIMPIPGGKYYVHGVLAALDAPQEWVYDSASSTLYFWAPAGVDPNTIDVRAKRRQLAFDLSGKTGVTVEGLSIFASTILTSASSSNNRLNCINAQYVSHFTALPDVQGFPSSYWYDHIQDSGIILLGSSNSLTNSVIAYSAGNGVALSGSGHTVRNNLIRNVDYVGNDTAGIALQGTDHVVRNNTISQTGRAAMNLTYVSDPSAQPNGSDIQYNNIYSTGLLTADTGAIYTGGSDGTGSLIAHNWIHDVQSPYASASNVAVFPFAGIYFDYGATNWLATQNVLWNIQNYSLFLHGDNPTPVPQNLLAVNNSVLDAAAGAKIGLLDVVCGTTSVNGNLLLMAVEQRGTACSATNNSASELGATEMDSTVQVGCNFAGCASATPPALINGAIAASVVVSPQSQSIGVGQSVSFSLIANGSGNIFYQWRRNDSDIPGANGPNLSLSNASGADDGAQFSAIVWNAVGAAVSDVATLTVH